MHKVGWTVKGISMEQSIVVRYGIDEDARRIFAKVLKSIDPGDMPGLPTFPGVAYVPVTGDVLQFDAIGREHHFIVENRVFRFTADGGIEIILAIGVSGNK
jgi:hypothetical protein